MEENNPQTHTHIPEASVVVAPDKPKRFNFPKFNFSFNSGIKNLIIKVAITVLIVILAFLIIYYVYQNFMTETTPPIKPTPTPFPTHVEDTKEPSLYAEDEEVLAIEEKIKSIELKLQEINFRDDRLRVPSLDWDINFE